MTATSQTCSLERRTGHRILLRVTYNFFEEYLAKFGSVTFMVMHLFPVYLINFHKVSQNFVCFFTVTSHNPSFNFITKKAVRRQLVLMLKSLSAVIQNASVV